MNRIHLTINVALQKKTTNREHVFNLMCFATFKALLCPENEKRMIVSLDMKAMNRVLWIDHDNMTMKVEAGAVGKQVRDTTLFSNFLITFTLHLYIFFCFVRCCRKTKSLKNNWRRKAIAWVTNLIHTSSRVLAVGWQHVHLA